MSLFGGSSWRDQKKLAAWQRCKPAHLLGDGYRFDDDARLICWFHYGDTSSEYGWEVDHITALALGGADSVHNVRALHWRGNRQRGAYVGNALNSLVDLAYLPEPPRNALGALSVLDQLYYPERQGVLGGLFALGENALARARKK